MADWKVLGIVPDSDEEDELDSQANEPIEDQLRGGEHPIAKKETLELDHGDDEEEGQVEQTRKLEKVVVSSEKLPALEATSLAAHDAFEICDTPKNLNPGSSTPSSPDIRQAPGTTSNYEGNDRPSVQPELPVFNDILLDEEDISHCYVQITSPESSQLSSPPMSQLLLPPNRLVGKEYESVAAPEQHMNLDLLVDVNESAGPSGRRFRKRKPIQLHPYVVENEKYRQTVKAGGMAPLRLASSQENAHRRSRNSSSPDQESSQQEISQYSNLGGDERDAMDVDWNLVSSSPPIPISRPEPPPVHNGNISGGGEAESDDDDDDDLPALEELVRRLKGRPPEARKKRIRSYSSKLKRHGLPHIQTHSRSVTDVFDVPASPPITSSPFPVTTRNFRSSISRLSSVSSTMQTPNVSNLADSDIQQSVNLPTPTTSVLRPGLLPLLLDSSSEGDSPFHGEPDETISSSSSSDEDVEIRKISRKFRGVLPASHLRLNQQKKSRPTLHNHRETYNLSPVKGVARRGVALPRFQAERSSDVSPLTTLFPYLSGDSEEDHNGSGGDMVRYNELSAGLDSGFGSSRLGLAEEDDRIDTMLPSRKRQSRNSNQSGHKKRRVGNSMTAPGSASTQRQPSSTKHLSRPTKPGKSGKVSRQTKSVQGKSQGRRSRISGQPTYPRIGILDLPDTHDRDHLPSFIKIAARTARQKKNRGRQSPSRKFIRLSTREDTEDVQRVFDEWRGGKIQLHQPSTTLLIGNKEARPPLQQISHNSQTTLPDHTNKIETSQIHHASNSARPRKIHIARRHQQSMNEFISRGNGTGHYPGYHPGNQRSDTSQNKEPGCNKKPNHPARPAQLESSEIEYSYVYPVDAFRSTKKALDVLYNKNRRRQNPQANVQLSRFLEDEDVVKQSVETDPFSVNIQIARSNDGMKLGKVPRVKKRIPQRLDAGAARYRQPSNPLIVDYLVTTQAPISADLNTKLNGLGKLGTRYKSHFDIFPLQPGIFFHQNTLIGRGALHEALAGPILSKEGRTRPRTVLQLGEKTFVWGQWDETVSSELGIYFDWIIEQLLSTTSDSSALDDDVVLAIASVLDYVRDHSTFKGFSGLQNFIGRMVEILGEFTSRLHLRVIDFQHPRNTAKLVGCLSVCMLLLTRLLRLARASDQPSLTWDVEECMKAMASFCAKFLLSQDLMHVRQLYDSLQYLSFRERGISQDQFIVQAWVILIKTLGAANVPRGSFWDILSPLLLRDISGVTDARVLEKTWFTMFSLLPLCEFDDFGVVTLNMRKTIAFDGWRLPQQLIKQVTCLYESNQKQPPGFNDYCRSLFARCHYLMTQWGWWKCTAVVGSLFDFFASQQLAHLRNEEVNISPQFLSELDTDPSLDVEPEDHCFHIFLKMVALVIKHLATTGNVKAIRNLVARLLPNHNRQYSQNEAIRQRDIASLRNHHDLLCTMYWAAPISERPAVALVQDLVLSAQSHNEACLINLRSWENLARFVMANPVDIVSYEPLKQWQTTFFSGLCQQFLGQDNEVRQQADILQKIEGEPMTEDRILETVTANMKSTMVPMCVSITVLANIIKVARSNTKLRQALNCDLLSMALNPAIHTNRRVAESLLSACLRVFGNYVDQIDALYPSPTAHSNPGVVEGDSQDSMDMAAFDWERTELALPLEDSIMTSISLVLRKYLESYSEEAKDPMLIYRFVECWARLVSLVIGNVSERGTLSLESFLLTGRNAVFEHRNAYPVANNYWPLLLARLLQNGTSPGDFKLPGFNIGLEWLLSLLKPQPIGWPEKSLSAQLHSKGYYLCSHVELHTSNRIYMIRGAIRKMSNLLIDKATDHELGLSQRDAKRLFSDMLGEVMRTMQRSLESLEPLSETHKDFVEIVQVIVADIKCYASDIEPLIEFFVHPSTFYWPPDTDPNLYGAGIVSYCIRLERQPEKTSWELFYYLYNGWKKALISGSTVNYVNCIKKSMKRWDFSKFLLAEFLPAIIGTGFSADGWILCSTFLPPLSNRVPHLLESRDSKSEWVFENLINMLRIITNGIIAQYRRLGGVHALNRGIIAVVVKFWLRIATPMRQYVERHPEKTDALSEVTDPLTHFIWHALQSFDSEEPEFWHPTGQLDVRKGKYYEKFITAFELDIKENWEFADAVGEGVVVKATRSKDKSPVQWFGISLKEILEREISFYQVLCPSTHEVQLPKLRNYFMDNLYV